MSEPKQEETYASIMKKVIANVKLSDIDVQIGAVRRTKAGNILLEVDGKKKTDILSCRVLLEEW